MRRLPELPEAARPRWFLGFALASWSAGLLATAAGHALAPVLPVPLRAALLFANPLYFALLLAADLARPGVREAVVGGAVAAPLALWLGPAWGLLAAGLVGGTAAFLWVRR
jgi:predicted branched-subunit amino acid permease